MVKIFEENKSETEDFRLIKIIKNEQKYQNPAQPHQKLYDPT